MKKILKNLETSLKKIYKKENLENTFQKYRK